MAKKLQREGNQVTPAPDSNHPDYQDGLVTDVRGVGDFEATAAAASDPALWYYPSPWHYPHPPWIHPQPQPRLPEGPTFCTAVSGRYTVKPPPIDYGPLPPMPEPLVVVARVDVDRFYPQDRISLELQRDFPQSTLHLVAQVEADDCVAYNHRNIRARIVYRDGDTSILPADTLEFSAARGRGTGYGTFTLKAFSGTLELRRFDLQFESRGFDAVEFEVDRVSNAGSVVTEIDSAAHPNRPVDLPPEALNLKNLFQRAGFEVTLSEHESEIPIGAAGANTTWSDSEMHNAMQVYWSRFAHQPQWAMWVLYAARHDDGRGLGGVMFDDIGPHHRQGTAIFTDSFIQDAPAGDPNPTAWRQRMQLWTAIHEMGHAFNLAHSWQKALGQGWIPLADEPHVRSFMNYPFRVVGGESAFFSDFRFRFSDQELLFMRHAPRRFVQMGNSNWFQNHGFKAPPEISRSGHWQLALRPNREQNTFRFMEPVNLEVKLTNASGDALTVPEHLLEGGDSVTMAVCREGGTTRSWRPMVSHCHRPSDKSLKPGTSRYASHLFGVSAAGWLVDEPGFYKLQAAVQVAGEVVVSNVLRIYVAPPATDEEVMLAPDYFCEDVARLLRFHGSPSLKHAGDTLAEVEARCPGHPAAVHAGLALSSPGLRPYKSLAAGEGGALAIEVDAPDIEQTLRKQESLLMIEPDAAATTLGHIEYFGALNTLAKALDDAGEAQTSIAVLSACVDTMRARDVLPAVVRNTERKLKRLLG